jgi:DNA adenine methylase
VLNDLDFDVANFLRVCQWHHGEFIRHLKYTVVSRRWYQLMSATDPSTLTDVQRAARFYYLIKNSYGGLVLKQHYHYGVGQRPNFNPAAIPEVIEAVHHRLMHAQIECLPYEHVLTRYDRPETFFFVDPPYWGPQLYKFNFTADDFSLLAERLEAVRGTFLLTLNDRPEVRQTFSQFHIKTVDISYSAQPSTGKRYQEVFITNYIADDKEHLQN